jgi:hypothetical protein
MRAAPPSVSGFHVEIPLAPVQADSLRLGHLSWSARPTTRGAPGCQLPRESRLAGTPPRRTPGPRGHAPARNPDHARAVITPPPATGNRQPRPRPPGGRHQPIRRSRLIRRVAGVLTGLAATLAPITTGPAAVASQLRPDPPGWLNRRAPGPVHLPPLPPGWNKHPPLPGPAHAALTGGMPGWQITLIAAAAVLAAAAAVRAGRMRAARRRATARRRLAASAAHQPRPRCT